MLYIPRFLEIKIEPEPDTSPFRFQHIEKDEHLAKVFSISDGIKINIADAFRDNLPKYCLEFLHAALRNRLPLFPEQHPRFPIGEKRQPAKEVERFRIRMARLHPPPATKRLLPSCA